MGQQCLRTTRYNSGCKYSESVNSTPVVVVDKRQHCFHRSRAVSQRCRRLNRSNLGMGLRHRCIWRHRPCRFKFALHTNKNHRRFSQRTSCRTHDAIHYFQHRNYQHKCLPLLCHWRFRGGQHWRRPTRWNQNHYKGNQHVI